MRTIHQYVPYVLTKVLKIIGTYGTFGYIRDILNKNIEEYALKIFLFYFQITWKCRQRRSYANLTSMFLTANSVAQLLYLFLVGPCEMIFMVTHRWRFGLVMCKIFKSWRSSCAGITIMTTVLMTADRLFGVLRLI